MRLQDNLRLAKNFLEKIGSGAGAEEIAKMCAADLEWNIPGDRNALPWVGQKTGRQAMHDFLRDSATLISRESLEVHDMLASDERAVILGHLKTKITSTNKLIDSAFAIVLKFRDEEITSFLMFEDSFAVSNAAR